MDLCGNWMDSFENKTKRRLRPRETKEDQKDDSNPSSAVSKNLINLKQVLSRKMYMRKMYAAISRPKNS